MKLCNMGISLALEDGNHTLAVLLLADHFGIKIEKPCIQNIAIHKSRSVKEITIEHAGGNCRWWLSQDGSKSYISSLENDSGSPVKINIWMPDRE